MNDPAAISTRNDATSPRKSITFPSGSIKGSMAVIILLSPISRESRPSFVLLLYFPALNMEFILLTTLSTLSIILPRTGSTVSNTFVMKVNAIPNALKIVDNTVPIVPTTF